MVHRIGIVNTWTPTFSVTTQHKSTGCGCGAAYLPSPNLPLPCSAFFNRISLQIIFHICFPCPTAYVLICHFPSPNFPLSFTQSATFLRPICHFHFQHFSTGFLFKSYFIFVSPSNCICPIGHFLSPNFPLPCYTFFLNWLNFTFNFFQTVQRTFTNYFQVLQYSGARQLFAKLNTLRDVVWQI